MCRNYFVLMFFFFISSNSFIGIGALAQFFWWARCHFTLCSKLAFFGILFFECHSLLITIFQTPIWIDLLCTWLVQKFFEFMKSYHPKTVNVKFLAWSTDHQTCADC